MLDLKNNTSDTLIVVSGATLNGSTIEVSPNNTVAIDESTLVQDHLQVFAVFSGKLIVTNHVPARVETKPQEIPSQSNKKNPKQSSTPDTSAE